MFIQYLPVGGTSWVILCQDEYEIGWHPNWQVRTNGQLTGDARVDVDHGQRFSTMFIPPDPTGTFGQSCHFTFQNDLIQTPGAPLFDGVMAGIQIRRNQYCPAGAKPGMHLGIDPKPEPVPRNADTYTTASGGKMPYFMNSFISQTIGGSQGVGNDWVWLVGGTIVSGTPGPRQTHTDKIWNIRPRNV
jgi:hypothetical protein